MRKRRYIPTTLRAAAGTCLLAFGMSAQAQSPNRGPAPPAQDEPAKDKGITKELSATELADKVQQFYDRTKTFQARFKQRYYVAAYRKTKDSHGEVVFQKPGYMSWRYRNNGNRVVSDGKVIKVYEKENKQMYEQNIEKSQYPAALSFLLGNARLKTEFYLKKLPEKDLGYEGGFVLLAVPKDPTPAYQQLLLYVDGGTFQVRRVLMIDAQQNRNRFDFLAPVVNKPVAQGEFLFHPPPGTRVIRP